MIRYLQKLEQATDTFLGEHIAFDGRKQTIFEDAVMHCCPDISDEQKEILNDIIRESENESLYRTLYKQVVENYWYNKERKLIHGIKTKIKTMVLFLPVKSKNFLKWGRNKCFSPLLESLNQLSEKSYGIGTDIQYSKTQIGLLNDKIETLLNELSLLQEEVRDLQKNMHGQMTDAEKQDTL